MENVNANKISNAENIINDLTNNKNVKIVKNNNGLLERTEKKIIIAENNKELILG